MPKSVYIETTIPSRYDDERTDVESLAVRKWTRDWWDQWRGHYKLVTSAVTIEELRRGNHPKQTEKLKLVAEVEILRRTPEIDNIVETYIINKLMPADVAGDAAHVAFASFYGCDYLLTWNCKHIANHNKEAHLRVINTRLGLRVPELVTPYELLQSQI
jgi:hypothetical protein